MVEKLNPVCVTWIDITTQNGWQDTEQALKLKPITLQTVGFLLNHDKESLTLVSTVSEEVGTNFVMTLPAGCVKQVKRLK